MKEISFKNNLIDLKVIYINVTKQLKINLLFQRFRPDKDLETKIKLLVYKHRLILLIDAQFRDLEIRVAIYDQLQMELTTKYYQINNYKFINLCLFFKISFKHNERKFYLDDY